MAMSTQDDSGIPFEIASSQENFRLLELPPSLLALITSKRLSHLKLKSATLDVVEDSSRTPSNVVLCTDNQTYQVRQVQSSNSVFVLERSETDSSTDDNLTSSLSAIAICTATLELIPATTCAVALLRHAVPTYRGVESSRESAESPEHSSARSKNTLLENAPLSSGEFDKAWKGLCAFEESSRAWLPTSSVLISVWKLIVSAATVRSVDIGEAFSLTTLGGVIEEDGHSIAVFKAVMDRLGSDNANDLMDGYALLSKEIAVPWVGAILLESQHPSTEGMPLSTFLEEWRNQLPEKWRKYAMLDVLKGKYLEPSKGFIIFSENKGEAVISSTPSLASKTAGKGAKNWHEKFKNARR